MRYYLIFFVFFFTSCDILKESQKTKKDIQQTEIIRTQIKRAGDTLRLQVPKITYKDTAIVKTNYINRTEARIRYDSQGDKTVECISSEINELKEEIRTLNDNSKIKASTKETSFNSIIILYICLGLSFLLFVYKKL